MHFIHISIIIAFGASCTGGNKQKSSDQELVINQEMQAVANLDSDQKNIATRICYAYQSKASNFYSSDYLNKNFKFNFKNKVCNSKTTDIYTDNLKIILSGATGFSFQATTSKKLYSAIQIDSAGYLSKLCNKVFMNQPISNTTNVDSSLVQIQFLNQANSPNDSYLLTYYKRSSNGKYLSYMSEKFDVRTQRNYKSGDILGLDEIYSEQVLCSDNASTSSFTQQFEKLFN